MPTSFIQTDLALEAHELAIQKNKKTTGVKTKSKTEKGITTSWIWLDAPNKELGRDAGTYLTIEVPALREHDSILEQRVIDHFTIQFKKFLTDVGVTEDQEVLLIGLGNWNVTADALGPLVIGKSLVTRHIFKLAEDGVGPGYRPVSALSPGVMGLTGIETSELVQGVVKQVRPDVVIAIDALASRSLARLNTTIQVTNAGISPGSGVGNKRKALNEQTLGCRVLAIGVPTVVDAATITSDTVDYLLAYLHRELTGKKGNPLTPLHRFTLDDLAQEKVTANTQKKMMGFFGGLTIAEKKELIMEVLAPLGQNLVVAPKEVDLFIKSIANIIACSLNRALHRAVTGYNLAGHL
jgi:spore protease